MQEPHIYKSRNFILYLKIDYDVYDILIYKSRNFILYLKNKFKNLLTSSTKVEILYYI